MNIAKLRSKAEGLVTQLTAKDDCEKRVLDAVAGHQYPAPRSLLNEIAEDTFSHDRYSSMYNTVQTAVDMCVYSSQYTYGTVYTFRPAVTPP